MKTGQILTILAGLAAVLLLILGMSGQVVLYTAEGNASTHDHMDASTVRPMTTEESETILPLMENIMKLSNDVVLEIRYTDKESALRTLKAYENSLSRLNTNAIKVKITGTDINEFKKEAGQLKEEMRSLLNNTDRLRELQKLQIQYADENNPGVVYELAYEGEALKKEIERAANSYIKSVEKMIPVADGYDRDTAKLQESIETVNEIKKDSGIEVEKIQQTTTSLPKPPGSITLSLFPAEVSYGDVLTAHGTAKYVPTTLSLYQDGTFWRNVSAETNGDFAFSFRVQKITAGEHTLSVLSGGVSSSLKSFTVLISPTYLNISETTQSSGMNATLLTVSGYLTTTNATPVTSAPVEIFSNEGELIATASTNAKGIWTAAFELPDGDYTIFASFSDPQYPLEESRSEEVQITIGTPVYYYVLIIAAAGAILILLIRFRKKVQDRLTPDEPAIRLPQREPIRQNRLPKMMKKFFTREKTETDTDPLRRLYKTTIATIAETIHLRNIYVYTPREFLSAVPGPSEDIREFISLYEYLHYANVVVDEIQMEKMRGLSQKIIEAYHETTE